MNLLRQQFHYDAGKQYVGSGAVTNREYQVYEIEIERRREEMEMYEWRKQ